MVSRDFARPTRMSVAAARARRAGMKTTIGRVWRMGRRPSLGTAYYGFHALPATPATGGSIGRAPVEPCPSVRPYRGFFPPYSSPKLRCLEMSGWKMALADS